jgi:hypothetical protein
MHWGGLAMTVCIFFLDLEENVPVMFWHLGIC